MTVTTTAPTLGQKSRAPESLALPEWRSVMLGEVVDFNPRFGKDELASDSLASFIPMRCVEEESGRFEPLGDRKVSELSKGYTPFRDGDVLFAKVTPCMENGKAAVVKGLTNGVGFGSTEFFALRPKENLDPYYLLHFILQSSFRRDAARNMTGAVGLRRVLKSYLEQQLIPLPSLPEQRLIVAEIEKQFTRLEVGVAALRRVQANLKRYRAAVLKAACEGRLVPTEAELAKAENRKFESGEELLARILTVPRSKYAAKKTERALSQSEKALLGRLPEAWAWATMRQVGEVQLGRQRAPQHHAGDHMRPYLRVANVFEARLDLTDVLWMNFTPEEFEKYRLRNGDILLNEGQTPELVGRPAMFRDEIPDCCYQKTLLRFRAYPGLLPSFALIVFRNYMHNGRFTRSASITTNIAHLTAEKFVEIEFPLPPPAEQVRIVAEVERRLSVAEQAATASSLTVRRSSRLRQAILQRAFGGE